MPTVDGVLNILLKLLIPLALGIAGALTVFALLDRLALDEKAAAHREFMARYAALEGAALAPGSVLACLNGIAGEAVADACESAVFAAPQSVAAALSFTASRLGLMTAAQGLAPPEDPALADALNGIRRAIETDRFGLAAHVLADRDGCTIERCAVFGLLHDAAALKSNLKSQPYDLYVTRYAAAWNKTEPKAEPVAAAVGAPVAALPETKAPGQPVSSQYDFPSSASIPPVSIMNAEPPLGKAAPSGDTPESKQPLPPKRPQAQAATPPAETQPQAR